VVVAEMVIRDLPKKEVAFGALRLLRARLATPLAFAPLRLGSSGGESKYYPYGIRYRAFIEGASVI
jgi:hypothetical protein